jgi:hypothetical protein
MKIRKILFTLFSVMVMIIGCSSEEKAIESFKGEIEEVDVEGNSISVECSDDIYLNEEEKQNLIAYLCTVKVDAETTIIKENTEDHIVFSNMKEGQEIKVILSSPQEMSKVEESRVITAKEIIVY